MTTKQRLLPVASLAFALTLLLAATAFVPAASADPASYPRVSATGEVGFDYGGSTAATAFEARATGPAAPGEEHQPATGSLHFEIQNGLAFTASVEHIHAHSATEVHFGGPITKSNDPSLVGKFVHCVAIDGSPDQFSLIVTGTDVHEHGAPAPIVWGKIKVRT
jgi:hypothetical protein